MAVKRGFPLTYRAIESQQWRKSRTGKPGVACRIHPSGDGPDHILPVADVDVVIDHHDELGVHELAQKTPDSKHHPAGVAGVRLLDTHHRHAIAAAFGRQVEIDDLGVMALQQWHKASILAPAAGVEVEDAGGVE